MSVFGLPRDVDGRIVAAFREAATTYESSRLATGSAGHPSGMVEAVALTAAVALAASGHEDAESALLVIALRACEMWMPDEIWNDAAARDELIRTEILPRVEEIYEAQARGDEPRVLKMLSAPLGHGRSPGMVEARALHRFATRRTGSGSALLIVALLIATGIVLWLVL